MIASILHLNYSVKLWWKHAKKPDGVKGEAAKLNKKPQNKWFGQECETEKENLQSLGENISHNINNSELRQLLRDKKKRFK